jgi:hypothetical protein
MTETPTGTPRRWLRRDQRLIDAAWLIALTAYLFGGLALIPLHGDEVAYVWLTRDWQHLIPPDLDALAYNPDPADAADEHLQIYRVATGAVPRYGMGIAWWVAGYRIDDVPVNDWNWDFTRDQNVEAGNMPPMGVLVASRAATTLILAAGMVGLFVVSSLIGGRVLAYMATGLYALHPLVLLEGRRAMSEGWMTGFTLLAVALAAVYLTRQPESIGLRRKLAWLTGIGALIGLAFTSKQTGLSAGIAIGIVFAVIAFAAHRTEGWLRALWAGVWPSLWMALIALIVFFALSVPYWRDPVGATVAAYEIRDYYAGAQAWTWGGYTSGADHIVGMYRQMLTPIPLYFDASDWAPYLADAIRAYEASPFSGLELPPGLFAVRAVIGLAALIAEVVLGRDHLRRQIAALALTWVVVNVAMTFALIDLEWQRYYFPVVPPAIFLAAVGGWWVVSALIGLALSRLSLPSGTVSRLVDLAVAMGLGELRTRRAVIVTALLTGMIGSLLFGVKTQVVDRVVRPVRMMWFEASDAAEVAPLGIIYGSEVTLIGAAVAPEQPRSGSEAVITLNWTLSGESVHHEYATIVEVVNADGIAIAEVNSGYNIPYQTSSWVPGTIIEETLPLRIPPGTPPGDYTLRVRLYASRDELVAQAVGADGVAMGSNALIGVLAVQRPTRSADLEALNLAETFNQTISPQIDVIGATIEPASNEVGQPFYLTIGWWVKEKPETELLLNVGWVDPINHIQCDPVLQLKISMLEWQRRDMWVTKHLLHVPACSAAGEYQLWIQAPAYQIDSTTTIGMMVVGVPERSFDVPNMQHSEYADWDNGITLIGFDVPAESTSPLTLTLYFQPQKALDQSLTLFVHLLDADGNIVAQRDAVPLGGARPTTGWAPGEIIAETITLNAAPGEYTIRTGWYNAATGARVLLAFGEADFYLLESRIQID